MRIIRPLLAETMARMCKSMASLATWDSRGMRTAVDGVRPIAQLLAETLAVAAVAVVLAPGEGHNHSARQHHDCGRVKRRHGAERQCLQTTSMALLSDVMVLRRKCCCHICCIM